MKYSLVIDLGNTSVKYAVFAGDKYVCSTKIVIEDKSFSKTKSTLQEMLSKSNLQGADFEDAMLFSVVPDLNKTIQKFISSVFKLKTKVFDINEVKKLPEGVPMETGSDLLADIYGGDHFYGCPVLIADLGTVTKFIFMGEKKELVGCSFMPGMDASLKSMTKQTALLPKLRIEKPEHEIGRNTIECMKSGVYYSTVASLKHFMEVAKKQYPKTQTVVTGGYSDVIKEDLKDAIYDPLLTLKGMNEIRLVLKKGI